MHWTIYTNNKGASLFNSGDYFGAIQAFQCGVDAMLAAQQPQPHWQLDVGCNALDINVAAPAAAAPSPIAAQMAQGTGVGDFGPAMQLAALTTGTGIQPQSATLPSLRPAESRPRELYSDVRDPAKKLDDDTVLFVFNRPLLLHRELPSIWSSLSSTTVLLFNYGLACHQYGRMCGSEVLLRRATQLYNLTLHILYVPNNDNHNHMPFVQGIFGLLKCLALNNLAQLHYENCEYATSQDCLDCLSDMERLSGCLSSSTASSILSEVEYNEIILNLIHETQPPTARAA